MTSLKILDYQSIILLYTIKYSICYYIFIYISSWQAIMLYAVAMAYLLIPYIGRYRYSLSIGTLKSQVGILWPVRLHILGTTADRKFSQIFFWYSHTLSFSTINTPPPEFFSSYSIVACHRPPPLPIGKQLQEPIAAEFIIIILDICSDHKRIGPKCPCCKRIMRIYIAPSIEYALPKRWTIGVGRSARLQT